MRRLAIVLLAVAALLGVQQVAAHGWATVIARPPGVGATKGDR